MAYVMAKSGFGQNVIAVSSLTLNGMVNLMTALSRILGLGEDT
jgi:hypothetical protein